MDEQIVVFKGEDLMTLQAIAADLAEGLMDLQNPIRKVRFWFDEGALKIKINEYTWSPPLGTQEDA